MATMFLLSGFLSVTLAFGTNCDSQNLSCQSADADDLHGISLMQVQIQLDRASVAAREPIAQKKDLGIIPPAPGRYHLNKGPSYAEWAQDLLTMPLFGGMKDGFFVEAGAVTGEEGSNTMMFELEGWTGLLVEPKPQAFQMLKSKGRKAFLYNGCLSTSNEVEDVTFFSDFESGGFGTDHLPGDDEQVPYTADAKMSYNTTCAPLQTMLEAVNRSTVDFWSLDVEGAEPGILENTDFDKIEVGVLCIEWNCVDDAQCADAENKKPDHARMQAALDKNGFQYIGSTYYTGGWGTIKKDAVKPTDPWVQLDRVYVNPKYFEARGLEVPTELPVNPIRPAPAPAPSKAE